MTEHPNLAAALVAALAELTVIEATSTAKIPGKDGKAGYSYDYANIAEVVKATRPTLADHGLVVLTPVHDHGNGLACTVTVLHESGESLDLGAFPFPHGKDAQATGSMVTYHRRYALIAALGMGVGEDDDDGAKATARPAMVEQQPVTHPAHVQQVLDATKGLDDRTRGELRDYIAQLGLPGKPADLNEEQAGQIIAWINGDPEVSSGAPSSPVGASEQVSGPNPPYDAGEAVEAAWQATDAWLKSLDAAEYDDLLASYDLATTGSPSTKLKRLETHLRKLHDEAQVEQPSLV